jgi:hypothetical protein
MSYTETLTTRRRTLAAASIVAAGSLLLAGCSGDNSQPPKAVHETSPSPTQSPTQEASAAQRALDDFRNRFYKKHIAKISLGLCVAWQYKGGVLVTSNPGTAIIDEQKELAFPVASDSSSVDKTGDVTLVNGPDGKGRIILIPFKRGDGSVSTKAADISISPEVVHDKNGQIFHFDPKSKEPVINSTLVNMPFEETLVAQVCVALRGGEPIPSASTSVQPA